MSHLHRPNPRARAFGLAAAALSVVALITASTVLAADTVNPVVDVATLTPTAADGNANWRRVPATLNLSATDDIAVAKFQYSLDGGATYIDVPVASGPSASATVPISQQGNTTIRYRAVDSSGNNSLGASVSTTLNQASAVGATGVRLQSTTGRAAGDVLVIDTGAGQETATIASVPAPAPPSPNPNVLLTAPLANAHAAGVPVSATPPYRTIAVLIDSFAPLALWATQPTTLNTAAAAGATEVRLASLGTGPTARAAGEVLVLDQGDNAETVTIASLVSPPPAAPAANVVLTGPLTKSHLSGAAVFLPAITDGKVLQSKTLTPLRTDPRRRDATDTVSNGSGGAAIRRMEIDGKHVLPFPLALNRLTVGKHTQAVALQDSAGNALKHTLTFVVTTSFDDLDTVLQQYASNALNSTLSSATAVGATGIRLGSPYGFRAGQTLVIDSGANQETVTVATAPSPPPGGAAPHLVLSSPLTRAHAAGAVVSNPRQLLSAAVAANLQSLLAQAKAEAGAANTPGAIAALQQFNAAVHDNLTSDEKAALISAGKALIDQVKGDSVDTAGTGVTTSPWQSLIRTFWNPTFLLPNPNATFKVLINGRAGGFRHESIVDFEAMIQQLGTLHNFDVDIWDPNINGSPGRQAPAGVSLPTSPFLDLATLMQYKTIVFNSTVGINNTGSLGDGSPPPPGPTLEFQNFQAYIRAGGGMVAIHGATDAYQDSPWYVDLVGATFTNHGSNAGGIVPDCGSCGEVDMITAEKAHPATHGFPDRFRIHEELYNTNRNPVALGIVHPLVLEDEDGLVGQLGYGTGTLMNSDQHGMVWCRNFDGGRSFTNNLGHNWQFAHEPWFQQLILKGIQTTAGVWYANCVTFNEVSELLTASAGNLSDAGNAALSSRLASARAEFEQGNYGKAIGWLNQFVAQTKKPVNCAAGCPDHGVALDKLEVKGGELADWAKSLR